NLSEKKNIVRKDRIVFSSVATLGDTRLVYEIAANPGRKWGTFLKFRSVESLAISTRKHTTKNVTSVEKGGGGGVVFFFFFFVFLSFSVCVFLCLSLSLSLSLFSFFSFFSFPCRDLGAWK